MKSIDFSSKKIFLIGDAILDIHTYGTQVCEALDAPVPEVQELRSEVSFGGAGLVAKNILELGGKLTFCTLIGRDKDARQYDLLKHRNLAKLFFVDPTRRTTVKQHWFVDGAKRLQANKVDNHYIDAGMERTIFQKIEPYIKNSDVILISDPQHGLLSRSLIRRMLAAGKKYHIPVYVDSQISHRASNAHWYKGADCFFLNEKEARAVYLSFSVRAPEKSLEAIQRKLQISRVVVKLGAEGSIALFDGQYIKTRAYKVRTIDPCGAGDAFVAAFSACDVTQPQEALNAASAWAALSTTIQGTVPPKRRNLTVLLRTSSLKRNENLH